MLTAGDFPWNPIEALRWLAFGIVAAAVVFNVIAFFFGDAHTKGIRTGLDIGIPLGALLVVSALEVFPH